MAHNRVTQAYVPVVQSPFTLRDDEPFPMPYYEALGALWSDSHLQQAYDRGNEVALPENLT